ncbi:MAG TPA: class I SAM-dependent RNA methyltransferase [Rectinemataceae bacterium]|nr:class I SAM-dependent RNA methyltransferase [Rectinemataceae bacterium]
MDNESFEGCALCALGLEKVLTNEIAKIGLEASGRSPGRIFFRTDLKGLFRANLELRTAERILLVAARYEAPDFDALFEGARRPAWQRFFASEDKLVIERVRSRDSRLEAQTSVQSVVHKAIYESLGKAYRQQRMPETGRTRSLRVYLDHDECILGLDLSGDALHKRGWRKAAGDAPLKETVAAGILLLAGWRRRLPLLDPFCGSGTFLVEAAHFALERAPGLDRHFEIETMPLLKEGAAAIFADERQRARAAVRKDVELRLVGSDSDPRAIEQVQGNAARAGVAPFIEVSVASAEDAKPYAEEGLLITNPPWGERLGTEAEARALYGRLGKAWGIAPTEGSGARGGSGSGRGKGWDERGAGRRNGGPTGRFAGWSIGVVTNAEDAGLSFGRRAPVERRLQNGSEEHWVHLYTASQRP